MRVSVVTHLSSIHPRKKFQVVVRVRHSNLEDKRFVPLGEVKKIKWFWSAHAPLFHPARHIFFIFIFHFCLLKKRFLFKCINTNVTIVSTQQAKRKCHFSFPSYTKMRETGKPRHSISCVRESRTQNPVQPKSANCKNTGTLIICSDCSKPRLLHSKLKLKQDEVVWLHGLLLNDFQYTPF